MSRAGGEGAGPIALIAAGTLVVLAGSGVAPALPGIARHYEHGALDAGLLARLVLTTPALAVALSAPLAAWWARRAPRGGLLVGLLLAALAGSAGLWVGAPELLLGSRIVLGVGLALVMTTSTTLVAGIEGGRWIGAQGFGMELGALVYGLLGGVLAEASWRLPFALFLLALPAAVGVALRVPRPAPCPPGPAAKLAWGRLLPVCLIAAWAMVLLNLVLAQGPFHLEGALSLGPASVGLALGLKTVGSACSGLAYGGLRRRLGPGLLFSAAFLAFGFGLLGWAWPSSFTEVLAASFVAGLGFGVVMPAAVDALARSQAVGARAKAMAALTAAAFLGQFLSPMVVAPLEGLGLAWVFTCGFASCVVLGLIGLGVALRRGEHRVQAPGGLKVPFSAETPMCYDTVEEGPAGERSDLARARARHAVGGGLGHQRARGG